MSKQKARSRIKKSMGERLIAPILFVSTVAASYHVMTVSELENRLEVQSQPIIIEKVVAAEPAPTPEPTPTSKSLYYGKVSYYSHDGCLGCGESQTMGNGQPFDENAMTLAVPCEDILSKKIRYNTRVKVVNLSTGYFEEATITDCGGFSKYNRVADLSKGLAQKIGAKTDQSIIRIEEL